MDSRLPASLMVGALLRLAQNDGGFGTVIAKGDDQSGAILVLLSERGHHAATLERLLQANGRYAWQENAAGGADADLQAMIVKRRGFDPDCWIIELDTASAERFAAEMKQLD